MSLPLPPKELSPNSRTPWRIYAVLKGKARDEGRIAALCALAGEPGPRWERCVATVQFTYPDRIRRDTSNSFAACKHFWDSLTDVGIWRDDQYVEWHILPAAVDRERAGLVVTVEGER